MESTIKTRSFIKVFYLVTAVMLLLSGCYAKKNMALTDSFWQNKQQKIVVVSVQAPEPGTYKVGDQGLVDYTINSVMSSDLDAHLKKMELSWYHNMSKQFTQKLQTQGIHATYIEIPISEKQASNYTKLAQQYEADKLLIIKLDALGTIREYYGFIPTTVPHAYCVMTGQLIDKNNPKNPIIWYHRATVKQPAQGKWDQPPSYPNLTNAIRDAINTAQSEIVDSFFSGT